MAVGSKRKEGRERREGGREGRSKGEDECSVQKQILESN